MQAGGLSAYSLVRADGGAERESLPSEHGISCRESLARVCTPCVHCTHIEGRPIAPCMSKIRKQFRLDDRLAETAERYASDSRISLTAVVSMALSDFLRRHGYLPPEPANNHDKS